MWPILGDQKLNRNLSGFLRSESSIFCAVFGQIQSEFKQWVLAETGGTKSAPETLFIPLTSILQLL